MSTARGRVRIGELARRTGVSPALLRAWERRYAVIEPERSPGGTRLYSARDEARVRAMQVHLAAGVPAAEAARAVHGAEPEAVTGRAGRSAPIARAPDLDRGADALHDGLARLDREQAERALDLLLSAFTFETVAVEVLLPYLVDVGVRWARGEAAIAEEHLAAQILRARLLALTHGLTPTGAAQAVLACPPGEQHDIALVMLAVALARRGWPVTLLGANTPVAAIRQAADLVDADCVVVAATRSERIGAVATELRGIAVARPLLLAGAGATSRGARRAGASLLDGDPIAAAVTLDQQLVRRRGGRRRGPRSRHPHPMR